MSSAHDFSSRGFIGGPDSVYEGDRREVPLCKHGCRTFLTDDGTMRDLRDADKDPGEVCPYAPKPTATLSGSKRARSRKSMERSDSEEDSDSDDEVFNFDPGDPLHFLTQTPINIHHANHLVATGAVSWIRDPSTIASTHPHDRSGSTTVRDPEAAAKNAALLHEVMALRQLCALLALEGEREGEMEVRTTPQEGDITMDVHIEGAASEKSFTPAEWLEDSICKQALALGLRTRSVRAYLRKDKEDSERVVPDARAPGGYTDVSSFARREDMEDYVTRIDAWYRRPKLMKIADLRGDPDFVVGVTIAKVAFDPDVTARRCWRAVARYERKRLQTVKKDFKDEIKRSRERQRDAHLAKVVQAAAAGAAGGGGGGGRSGGGGRGSGGRLGARLLGRGAGRGRGGRGRSDNGNDGGGAKGAAGQPTGGDGGDGRARAAAKTQSKQQVLALEAAQRSNTQCRRHGLCLNCREEGHMAADCTEPKVDYAGEH